MREASGPTGMSIIIDAWDALAEQEDNDDQEGRDVVEEEESHRNEIIDEEDAS